MTYNTKIKNQREHIQIISAMVLCLIAVSGCIPILHNDRWDSLVSTRVEPADNWTYEGAINPRFIGEYRVDLVSRPIEHVPQKEFELRGSFRVKGTNGELIVEREFNVQIDGPGNTELCRFKLSSKQVRSSVGVELRIDSGGAQLSHEFSNILFEVTRVAKIGLTY